MKKLALLATTILFAHTVSGQNFFSKGLEADEEAYGEIKKKPTLVTRSFSSLPSSYSLLKYCPDPPFQGQFGTCTAWSSAFTGRTIAEAIANGWDDPEQVNKEAFSPWFVYTNIRKRLDDGCMSGSSLEMAIQLMKNTGSVKMSTFSSECVQEIPQEVIDAAAKYKIDDYFTLFEYMSTDYPKKINAAKKALANNRPVVFGMSCPDSFAQPCVGKDVWDGVDDGNAGGHAMCLVAYDDEKYGGAFLVQNSWGKTWGVGGRIWIRYDDWAKYTKSAFEMYVKPKEVAKRNELQGEFYIQLATGEKPAATFDGSGKIPHYDIHGEYISGTRYRIYISNNEPAYVYMIGSDLYNNVGRLFPPDETVSPAMLYKSNEIAIPDETWYVEMDETVGTDYLCVLYCAESIDIDSIVEKIASSTEGSFYERLKNALGDQLVPADDVRFSAGKIEFSAKTNGNVLPIVGEITHN